MNIKRFVDCNVTIQRAGIPGNVKKNTENNSIEEPPELTKT